jgi:hypothetical protein
VFSCNATVILALYRSLTVVGRWQPSTKETNMKLLVLSLALVCMGCVNPYAKFYQGAPDARSTRGYVQDATPVQIFSTSDFQRDGLELMRRGYVAVGQSSFNAGTNAVKGSQLRAQAGRIGAQVVLVSSRYTNTATGAVPLAIPTTSTTTSSGTATAYGSGGSATAYGTGTSTTTGSQTVMMPYSIARADFNAQYFVRVRLRLGTYTLALDDSTRLRLQTNAGVRVVVVVTGSPAFGADILPGDILLQAGSVRIQSPDQFTQLLAQLPGPTVTIAIDRGGRRIEKTVLLAW